MEYIAVLNDNCSIAVTGKREEVQLSVRKAGVAITMSRQGFFEMFRDIELEQPSIYGACVAATITINANLDERTVTLSDIQNARITLSAEDVRDVSRWLPRLKQIADKLSG